MANGKNNFTNRNQGLREREIIFPWEWIKKSLMGQNQTKLV